MTGIGSVSSLAIDEVKATAAAARIPLLVERAPTPPGAAERQIEAGRKAIEAAKADAAAAADKVRQDQGAGRPRSIVV